MDNITSERLKDFLERNGYVKSGIKYLLPGGEILKLAGTDAVLVSFKKGSDSDKWKDSFQIVNVVGFSNYNPLTMTYLCEYKTMEGNPGSFSMNPEGFSFENSEETGTMTRLVPLSLHSRMIEDENFHFRMIDKFENSVNLGIEGLLAIQQSSDCSRILRYSNNVQAIVKTITGQYGHFRIISIKIDHVNGKNYEVMLESLDNEVFKFTYVDGAAKQDFSGLGDIRFFDLKD